MTVGTYIPGLTADIAPQGVEYGTRQGQYHISEDGKLATVTATVQITSKGTGGAGHAHVTLPFPIGADAPMSQGAARVRYVTFPLGYTFCTAHAYKGRADVCLVRSGSGKKDGTVGWSEIGDDTLINFTIQFFL